MLKQAAENRGSAEVPEQALEQKEFLLVEFLVALGLLDGGVLDEVDDEFGVVSEALGERTDLRLVLVGA